MGDARLWMPEGESAPPDVAARGGRGGRGGGGRGAPGRGRGLDAGGAAGRGSPPIAGMALLRPGPRPSGDLDFGNQRGGGGGDVRVPSRGRGRPSAHTVSAEQGGSRDAGSSQAGQIQRRDTSQTGAAGSGAQQVPQQGPRLILGAKSVHDVGGAGSGARSEGSSRPGQGPAVVKLISAGLSFSGGAEAAKVLTDNSDFWVVAAIGLAGAGKSSILNEVASLSKTGRSAVKPTP
ncbi:hypothetical protein T484DRAFT_2302909 [Baffinella frigidus]|nr:hypothetical protein T484DRAFT_2302909 [Cryptophyta sp. CCMP2293]